MANKKGSFNPISAGLGLVLGALTGAATVFLSDEGNRRKTNKVLRKVEKQGEKQAKKLVKKISKAKGKK